jgi:hypothetical protein
MRLGGIALQSTTTNGPPARGLASWIDSAAPSLPVPVSPSISTVASVGAIRSSCENSSRIRGLTPTSGPNASRSEPTISASPPSISTRSWLLPSASVVPPPNEPSVIAMPDATVPLRLPRSRARTRSPAIASSQWNRDTVGSSMIRSLDGCEPIAQRSAMSAQRWPAAGPAVTVTRNRRIARRGAVEDGRVMFGAGGPSVTPPTVAELAGPRRHGRFASA